VARKVYYADTGIPPEKQTKTTNEKEFQMGGKTRDETKDRKGPKRIRGELHPPLGSARHRAMCICPHSKGNYQTPTRRLSDEEPRSDDDTTSGNDWDQNEIVLLGGDDPDEDFDEENQDEEDGGEYSAPGYDDGQ
jgi:hypothetical protein